MSYTYFILAKKSEIAQMQTIDDVFKHTENFEPLLGGDFTLESITNLSQIFLNGAKGKPIPTKYVWADDSHFYYFDNELCQKVALTEWNEVLNASVPWSESDFWKKNKHNRMDLAGMIIDFAALCKQTNNEKHLYFLLSNED